MTTCRKAIRALVFMALAVIIPLTASAGTFEVKALIDVDHSRTTGCSVTTQVGIVGGVDMVVTTAGTTNGTTASVTAVTRQTCVNAALNLLSSPVAVDGGWNVGISPTGDLTVETHVGADVITAYNVGTPRFVFTTSAGLLSDFLLTTYPSTLTEIVLPPLFVGRRRPSAGGAPRVMTLDGDGTDWTGVAPLAHGTAAFPGWRFITASVVAGAHDLYFNFQIHTNPAAPTAHDDSYSLGTVGGTLTVAAPGVLGNDNPNNQTITATQTDPPQHGALTLNPNGGFTYIHDGSLVSQDQFRYMAQGPVLPSNVATVTIDLPGSHPYVFTSANSATFTAGQASVFIVTVTGKPTPALTETGALPNGIVFTDNHDGTASIFGTPSLTSGGVYNLQITAEKNKPHETSQDFTLTVGQAPAITSAAGTTFTTGSLASFTVTATGFQQPVLTETGALPSGVSFNASTGVLSGTPAGGSGGLYNISFTATNNFGTTTQPFVLTVNQAPAITSANNVHLQAGTPANFIVTTTGFPAPALTKSGALPAGVTFTDNGNGTATIGGTPTNGSGGTYPLTLTATNAAGTANQPFSIVVCNNIVVNNPATTTAVANAAFSQTFTQVGAVGTATFTLNSGTLPTGLALSAAGVLSGTPTQTGSFPITVKVSDSNGCIGIGGSYALVITCQTITVTNPATNTGTVNIAFSQSFTAGNTIGAVTFSTISTLPAGLALSAGGVLSGTPTQTGTFPIVVKATDANGCSGSGASYSLTIGCQTITVNNPATNTGTVNVAFSQSFTAGNTIGATTYSTASTLPAGITLSAAGILSGTPTQTGSFPIVVHVVDANGCSGNSATYTLTIGCQVITVNKPVTASGTVNVAFSQTFTTTNAIGSVTFSTASTLPTGLSLSAAGVLSGTPTQNGSFPIVVHAVDANGCSGNSTTYTLTIACQVITVTNPATATGTVNIAFTRNFTAGNTIGTVTFTTSSALPAGVTLAANGTLSGTPTQSGTFPIVVTATDANGCPGTGATYNLVIACQVITVTNPATNSGTVNIAFSQTFTAGNTIGAVTFSTASGLPAGLTLSSGGVLSGTPTQTGSFPIVVTATDANGCSGSGATYTLTIGCQTISVTNPSTTTGTVNIAFSQSFTAGNTIGTVTFSTASPLPAGLTLAANGTLSGTPTQKGTFPIVVKATDANGCFGSGASYSLVIGCQTITVNNPAGNTGTVSAPFSASFTASNTIGTVSFTTGSSLPAGITLSTAGLLAGTPTQSGTFPIVVTATDANGCPGTGATYNLIIGCQVITVTNPATTSSAAGTPLSINFTQSGAIGTATFTTSSTLPTGLTLAPSGTLSGTPSGSGGFPIVVTVTDANGCTGTNSAYTLTITCPTITVTNPGTSSGTAGTAFSQTFTQSGGQGTITWSKSGALPTGITFNTATGLLSGTPTVVGSFPITVTATDANGCIGTGTSYNLVINCQTVTVTNPVTNTGTVNIAFSQTFTAGNTIGAVTFSTASGLPAGLSLSAGGVLSGTPTQTGPFSIVVKATDANGCNGSGATYTLTIGCQTITVTNPATTTGTVNTAFSQTFTAGNTIGTVTFTTASGLPAGLSLSTASVLSGTPTQTGSFGIVVTATDANGCSGAGSTYTLVIGCQTIPVTNPSTTTGTVSTPFTVTFTSSNTIGTVTYTTASGLPAGITLSAGGVLAGTPTQSGTFPIVVKATDANNCFGNGATYTLIIGCQVITVTNPSTTSDAAGTPLSINFTQSGAIGTPTFTTASTLPTGLTLDPDGTLHGTPTQGGPFGIVVTVTDANGCTGTNPSYTLTITCPTINVTNPSTSTGTAGVAFNQTFTQSGGQGTITWSKTTGTLPTGITLNSSTGVLSGTSNQAGSFPITVTATDQNGCTGTGATYNLNLACQTISITNPGTNTGTVDAPFTATFTASGILGTATWSEVGPLPTSITHSSSIEGEVRSFSAITGITLNSSTGVLSGTPNVKGVFPITVKVTDSNGCFITSSYTLTINCQTITVTNPATSTGTVDAPFSQTFTQSAAHGTATFSTASTLPAGLTLSSAGVLSGTPTNKGTFPITVTVTDSNGCTGTSSSYSLVISCQTITVTNPSTTTGTAGTAFSQTFTQSGAHATASFTTASTLPTGFSLSTAGVLSGTTTQHGSFPITVTVTDANGCTGTSASYSLVIACNSITVTNPSTATGTVASPFSQTFTSSGTLISAAYTTASGLPTGLTLHSATGVLDGTPTQSGSFPIVVTVTDGNGCTGVGATYTLLISCNLLTVTPPGVTSGTAGTPFSQTFSQSGGNGTITWSETGDTLPTGISLNTSTGALFGTTSQTGTFNITVKATDGNGCSGTTPYTLTINCQTIAITNPATTSIQAGTAVDLIFTASGILGSATWSQTPNTPSDTLPGTLALNASTGHLAGTANATGTFNITVKVTDTNGCLTTKGYSLTVTCAPLTVTRTGGGSFPAGIFNTAYTGQSVTASGGGGSYTFAVTSGALPTSLSLSSAGAISGTPSATGAFNFTVTVTDTVSNCTGSQSFSINIAPVAVGDSYPAGSHLVDNTQFVITGGTTTTPATPAVTSATTLISNDLPGGAVTATPGTFATSGGGSVTIVADGTFIYTPKANPTAAAITSDSFTYTVVSNGITSTAATVNLTLANRVWYVKNNGAAGNGQSQSPFNTLAAAQTASVAGDTIYVYNGGGTTTGQNAGITLKANQQLVGEGVPLVVNTVTLKAGGTAPLITNTAGDGVTLNSGNTLKGFTVTGTSANGINGTTTAGLTIDTVTATAAGAAASALVLTTPSGTVTITNTTLSNSPNCLTINGGTAAFTMNNTNTLTANATQRSINFANLAATAVVNIGAAITDGGIGMSVATSAAGAQVSFTGAQTLTTTTNAAVTLSGNNATSVTTFSGTLAITTTTGSGFVGGAGLLNVSGTANITTGAATSGLSLNGTTIGASGVTFTSVNTTGATTGISLAGFTAANNVTVNSGTISGGTTGVSLSGANTSLTLGANAQSLTITGATTAISGTTFGSLTVAAGSTVNVSGATALNLNAGAVTGTFANVSSTGGTNGVTLTAVTGTWGVTAGTLTGATGSTFNAAGTSTGTVSWGAAITQANAANVVTISGTHTGTINFSGNVTSQTSGTGISISGSSGTYAFNGTNALTGTTGIVIGGGESGTITFSNSTTNTVSGTAFQVDGSVTPVTAAITYNGTIDKATGLTAGILVSVNTLNTPGTLTMSHTAAASGDIKQNATNPGGINVSNSSATISISNVTINGKGTDFVTLANNSGTVTLNGLNATFTGSGANPKKAVKLSGGGQVNINTGAANPVISNTTGTTATANAIDATGFTGQLHINNTAITGNLNADAVTQDGGQIDGASVTITNAGRGLVLSSTVIGSGTNFTMATTGGVNGVSLTSLSGQPLTIGGTMSGATGAGILINGGSSNITVSANITATGFLVDVGATTGRAGGTLTFSGTLGGAGTLAGTGIRVQNSAGTSVYTFSGSQTLGTGVTRVAAAGVTLAANNSTATFNFSGTLSIFNSGATAFSATGAGNLNFSTGGNIDSLNQALVLSGMNLGASTALTQVSSSGGVNGISFTNVTGGTFTITGGTLSGSSGAAFSVSGGNAVVSANNTISVSTAAKLVNVSGITGGTLSFTGVITGSASSTGITLGGSAGTINFSGGVTLDGAADTFTASNGSGPGFTLNVTGTNKIGNSSAPTGPALTITNTTIGASHVTFQKVSATGGANAVVLNTTAATGHFSITGDGTNANNASGGLMQNQTGDAISLNSTSTPSFNQISIQHSTHNGIKGTGGVTDFSLNWSTINDSGLSGNGATIVGSGEDSNINFATHSGGTENNISGVVTIKNNTLTNAYYSGVHIYNFAGTVSNADISNNTVTSSTITANSQGDGIHVVAFGSAGGVSSWTKATIDNNTVTRFPSGGGISFQAGNSTSSGAPAGSYGDPNDTAAVPTTAIKITNNTINGTTVQMNTNTILATIGGKGSGNFYIASNGQGATPLGNNNGHVIGVQIGGIGTLRTTITNNKIVANNIVGSRGITASETMQFATSDAPLLIALVTNNVISATNGCGIFLESAKSGGTMKATITGNNVAKETQTVAEGAIQVWSGDSSATTNVHTTVCLTINSNTATGGTNSTATQTGPGIGIRRQPDNAGSSNTFAFNISGFGFASGTVAQMESYVGGQNPGSACGTFGTCNGGGAYGVTSATPYGNACSGGF